MKKTIFAFVCILFFNNSSFADFHFGLMVGYSPLYLVDLSGGGASGSSTYLVKYELEYKGSPEAGIDIWNLNKHSWGFISGAQVSQEREMNSGKINGLTVNTASPTAKFQTSFVYLGTAYKWESFYIPLALTYGISKVQPVSGNADVKTGVGALLGFGYFFTDSFAIEYIGRSAVMDLNMSNGTTHENTNGTVSAPLLNLKYFF